jgi:hypothetical protein
MAAQFVEMVSTCKAYNTLPRAGGLLDQDSLFVEIMIVFEAAVAEKKAIEQRKQQAAANRKR